jgi:hypothetical protein
MNTPFVSIGLAHPKGAYNKISLSIFVKGVWNMHKRGLLAALLIVALLLIALSSTTAQEDQPIRIIFMHQ